MSTTYLCGNGHHGSPERRSVFNNGRRMDFSEMWTGKCAGTLYLGAEGREIDCDCDCHTPAVETVKRPDLFGNVTDTFASEGELNGFRPTQGRMI